MMVAILRRKVDSLLQGLGYRKKPDYRPYPQREIDYDALYDHVESRFPKIMKRLAE